MKYSIFLLIFVSILIGCTSKKNEQAKDDDMKNLNPVIQQRIDLYAPTEISADISHLTKNQKRVIELLIEAGKIADEIFWQQTSPSAVFIRDSLKSLNTGEAYQALEFVMINYGPYDRIENKRYIGEDPEKRPEGGNFYPADMTKEEFLQFIKDNPGQKDKFESQYTIIIRQNGKLKAIPYRNAYPQVQAMADKLEETAKYAKNETLKNYLLKRAEAFKTDKYFESDIAWMEIKDNDIDVIIGPIENYEDALFNYKTAYECVVMVKDKEATKELQLFNNHVKDFEDNLPYENKDYIRKKVGEGTQINFVNVIFFGGDCQQGTKTIACSLPNDPKVRELKGGGKNSMYKNMMEAKFDKIVVPIGNAILTDEQSKQVDKKSFTRFVTLHEVSHTLGRGYVYGNDNLTIRKALKEKYSAIEECKADILGIYNQKVLFDLGIFTQNEITQAMMTYLPGLYRSIRFGTEEAHGQSNLMQLNFLREKKAIIKTENGKFKIDENKFFEAAAELANIVLTIEAEGDYNRAVEFMNKYAVLTDEIKSTIESLSDIPRDINTTYPLANKKLVNENNDDATDDAVRVIQGIQ